MVLRVLERTRARVRSHGVMYKVTAQLVIMYGSKRWAVTGEMLKILERVPPPGGATDHRKDGKTQGRLRVGVPLGSGGNGDCGDPNHQGVHQEATGNHRGKVGLPPHL